MHFIETPIFTRRLESLLAEEEYRELQNALIERPEAGATIRGSGGLRKLRWAAKGRGKSGGVRVIYYWFVAAKNFSCCLFTPKMNKTISPLNSLKD